MLFVYVDDILALSHQAKLVIKEIAPTSLKYNYPMVTKFGQPPQGLT